MNDQFTCYCLPSAFLHHISGKPLDSEFKILMLGWNIKCKDGFKGLAITSEKDLMNKRPLIVIPGKS